MLTDTAIKAAKPDTRPYKLSDYRGLYLYVTPAGGRLWRLKYRFGGKEKCLSLGAYPDVSLKRAREKCDDARRLLADGKDPGVQKRTIEQANGDTFEAVFREWHGKQKGVWTTSHADKILRRQEMHVFPWLGAKPIGEITAQDLLAVLHRIESVGAIETAHRALQNCGRAFLYAIRTGRLGANPASALHGALKPVKPEHYPSITDPKAIGSLLRAIDGYSGSFITQCALKVAPRTFVRPGELRKAQWSEFDLDSAEWKIPAERMKMRTPHIVPLSAQVISFLRELQPLTGQGKFVFPGERDKERPMSENTVNAALRRLGYASSEMTGHGFRSMASTLLNERGWNRDAIERQLAHTERDGSRAAYNYAEYMTERRSMMQAWSNYLDSLKIGNNVVKLQTVAA